MKKRLLTSFMLIGLVAALVGGATFAIFTSSDSNDLNSFATGTVIVDAGEATQTTTFDLNNLAPGDEVKGEFTVTNNGTLDLQYDADANVAGNLFNLDANHAYVTIDENAQGTLIPGASKVVKFTVALPLAAGDAYQADYDELEEGIQTASGTLFFDVYAEQLRNNANPTTPELND